MEDNPDQVQRVQFLDRVENEHGVGDEDDEAGMEHEANVNEQADTAGDNGAEAEDDVENRENSEEHADDRDVLANVGGNDVEGILNE